MLGALGDRDGGGHAALWEMMLTFCRGFPGAWAAVDARKAVLPRLFSTLRCAVFADALEILYSIFPHTQTYLCDLNRVVNVFLGVKAEIGSIYVVFIKGHAL